MRLAVMRPGQDLALEVLATSGVAIHPGHFYEFPGDRHIVVSLMVAEQVFGEGMDRLWEFFWNSKAASGDTRL